MTEILRRRSPMKKLFLLLVLVGVGFAIYKAMNTETAAPAIPTDN